ncbi:hypothetical protein [Psychrobacillus vulpis]|uniref:hypothetical protein n=1 Tax=Psychrobacillus vulpis TaxID=2325572 RepID=UPI001409E5F6|nr:hypothetical protein [Psychrobacillus vulpis]
MEQERMDKLIEEMLKEYPRERVMGALDMLKHMPKSEIDMVTKVCIKIDEAQTTNQ